MSRNASAPSASNPSGMSERRVFSRVVMSSFLISTSPAALRSVRLAAFSLAITPASVSPFRVVMFHCQKLGSTSRFGSMMWPSSSARRCAPMPFSGGPASLLPMSPSLWQLEQAPVKSAWPFAASPASRPPAAAPRRCRSSPSRPATARRGARRPASATCRFGCVRSRATLAGLRFAAVTVPSFNRGEQRERGIRALQESDRTAASSWCAPAPRSARHRHRCPRSRRARRSSGPSTAPAPPGRTASGAIAESACARRPGTASRRRRCRSGGRRSRCCSPRSQHQRRRYVSAFASNGRLPCPTSPRSEAPRPSSPDRRAASAGLASSARPSAIAAAFHAGDGSHDAGLERDRVRSGRRRPPTAGARPVSGQRRGQDGDDEVGQRLRTAVSQCLGHVGRGLLGRRGDERRSRPVVGGRREGVEHGLALRGRRRGARLLVELERLAPHGLPDLREARVRRVVLLRQPPRRLLDVRVRARLHDPNQPGEIARFKHRHVELRRLLVLHAPDAAEVVIAIRADGGVRRTVQRARACRCG